VADGVMLAAVYDADLLTGVSTNVLIANFLACGAVGQGDGTISIWNKSSKNKRWTDPMWRSWSSINSPVSADPLVSVVVLLVS